MRDERDDRNTRVTTNDSNILVVWVGVVDLGYEPRSADNIKRCYTEKTFWIVDTLALEDFSDDWNSGIDLTILVVS